MKVRITYQAPQMTVDEVYAGRNADEIVAAMKKSAVARLPFALRIVVNAMAPLQIAQEVVRRYNAEKKKSLPLPQSCAEFLQLGEAEGIVTVLDS